MGACGSTQVEKSRRARNILRNRSTDRDAVLRAVQQKGTALEFASEELRGSWDVVAMAIAQDGSALRFASEELREDEVLVMLALETYGRALCFASADLRANMKLAMAAVTQDGDALQYVSDELRAHKGLVTAATKQVGHALGHAAGVLREEKDFVSSVVRENGAALYFAAPELRADKGVVLAAMENEGGALIYAERGTRLDISVEQGLVGKRAGRGENEHFDETVLEGLQCPWGLVWKGVTRELSLASRAASTLVDVVTGNPDLSAEGCGGVGNVVPVGNGVATALNTLPLGSTLVASAETASDEPAPADSARDAGEASSARELAAASPSEEGQEHDDRPADISEQVPPR